MTSPPLFGDHWTELDQVLEIYRTLREESDAGCGRSVYVVCGAVPKEWVAPGSYFERWAVCTPDRPQSDWGFLGYDVIDDTFSSAICGSGEFSVSERVSQMDEFAAIRSKLNANSLMPDLHSAVDLARFVDSYADGGSSLTVPCALLLVGAP